MLALLMVTAGVSPPATFAGGAMNIAVLDLECAGDVPGGYRVPFSDRLRRELLETGGFKVIERSAMEAILAEQGFQLSGCTTDECAVEAGLILGVDRIIAGSVGKVGSYYTVNLRMIDVRTAEIVKSVSVDCPCDIEVVLTSRLREAARKIAGIDGESEWSATAPAGENGDAVSEGKESERSSSFLPRWERSGCSTCDSYFYLGMRTGGERIGILLGYGTSANTRVAVEMFGDGENRDRAELLSLTIEKRVINLLGLHYTPQFGVGYDFQHDATVMRLALWAWEYDLSKDLVLRVGSDHERNLDNGDQSNYWMVQLDLIW